jgi:DNA-binding GntR family transcriptional regulator
MELVTAQQAAVTWLRRAIAEGELAPGDRIGQDAAAARIGVSLIPVREALRALESEGLVTYAARKGYVVTELDLAGLEEIYHLRGLLERDAVERGLPNAADADIDALEVLADACRKATGEGDVPAALAANRRFHFALYALAGSEQQLRLIRLLWDGTEAYRSIYYGTPAGEEQADRAHQAIVAAARDRDAARCVAELAAHREQALAALRAVLSR